MLLKGVIKMTTEAETLASTLTNKELHTLMLLELRKITALLKEQNK